MKMHQLFEWENEIEVEVMIDLNVPALGQSNFQNSISTVV